MKVQISIDDELLKKVDEFAKKQYTSRSGLFSAAASQYIAQQEVIRAVPQMQDLLVQLSDVQTELQKRLPLNDNK